MAVDQARVLDSETFGDGRGLDELRYVLLDALVTRIDPRLPQMARKAADGRGVRAPVVVDDDDQVRRLQMCDLVESLVGHAARQGPAPYPPHDMPADALAKPRLGDAERVAQRGRGVAVLDQVVLGLLA